MKVLNCPNCNGRISLDESRDFGFCSYCGTQIQINPIYKVQHSGTVNIDGMASVNSLIQKGFMQFDSGEEKKAEETFEKIMDLDPYNTFALVGKMISSGYFDGGLNYYRRLKSQHPNITQEEKAIININNCDRIAYLYCMFDDSNRIQYILNKYPQAIKLNYLNQNTCLNKNIDMIDLLSKSGYDITNIYVQSIRAAYQSTGYCDYTFYAVLFSPMMLERLLKLGVNPATKVPFTIREHDKDSYPYNKNISVTLYTFFSKGYGYKFKQQWGQYSVNYTPQMYLDVLKRYGGGNDPAEKAPTNTSGCCYVATAVYGSYDCPQVWTLRRFRDYNLSKTWYGRLFIKTYYSTAPTVLKLFGNKEWFNRFFRINLDKLVYLLNQKGYENLPYND